MQHIRQNQFALSVTTLATGSAGAQAITIIFTPLLTRVYGPEAFGLLGIFTALVASIAPLAAMAYPTAIVLPKHDRDALGLVRLCIYISFSTATLSALILWFCHDWLKNTPSIGSISPYFSLIPLAVLFTAWLQISQQWNIRHTRFRFISRVTLTHSLLTNSAKTIIGLINPAALALILVATFGQAAHALMLIKRRAIDSGSGPRADRKHTLSDLKRLALKHRDFPIYRAPQNLINAISHSIPIIILAALFGPEAAGFYGLAVIAMAAPSNLVGKAISDVFYPHITQAARDHADIFKPTINLTMYLAMIGIVPFGIIILFGPEIFGFVFGQDWRQAGEYARWLSFFFFFNFINKPSVASVPVLGLQRGLLIYEVLSSSGKIGALIIGFYYYSSDIIAIALFSVIGAISYVALIAWILLNARKTYHE